MYESETKNWGQIICLPINIRSLMDCLITENNGSEGCWSEILVKLIQLKQSNVEGNLTIE